MIETSRLLFPSLRFCIFFEVSIVRLNHSGLAGISGIGYGAARAIVRALSRSCGKKTGYKALRKSVGVTPTTRRKTWAKWLGLV